MVVSNYGGEDFLPVRFPQSCQIQIPGYADWDPWDSAAKTMFLAELERRGRIHRVEHPNQRTPGGYRIGPGPK